MSSNQTNYDVIVVGAGLIGAAFALKLAQSSDYRILLVERSKRLNKNPAPNQRVLALGRIAIDLLKDIGVFAKLEPSNCSPYKRMVVWDEMSDGELEFDAQQFQSTTLGYMVDAINLTLLLQQEMDEHPQIKVSYSQALKGLNLEPSRAYLSVTSDKDSAPRIELSAPLIVAADGVNSWCRQQAKIFSNSQDYQQKGIVARVETELSHQQTAWQIFLNSGPLGLLPLVDNQCSIVWSADNQRADALLELTDEDFSKELTEALQHRLGQVKVLSQRQSFPLTSKKAETYFKPRLVLIGDAAHSIHPLAGQGANLGFKDVVELVQQLTTEQANSLGDLAMLNRYQRARMADNEQTDMLMSVLYTAFKHDSGLWSTVRGFGMNWISRSQQIKSMLAKQAMGQL